MKISVNVEKLRRARVEAGYSADALSKAIGRNRGVVSQIEKKRTTSALSAAKIAMVLNVPLAELFTIEEGE